jgi:hypothetical protein
LLAHARELAKFHWQFRLGWFGLAVVSVMVAGPLSRVWLWYFALRRLGAAISLLECFRILRLSQLAKYLPGSMWHYVGVLYLTHSAGVTRETALSSLFYDQGASLVAAGLVVMVLTYLSASLGSYEAIWTIAGACVLIGMVFVHPMLVSSAARLLYRVLKQRPVRWLLAHIERLPLLPPNLVGRLVVLNAGSWVILGGSLYFLVLAVAGPEVPLPDAVIIGAVGVVAGFLAPFAPSGIGVTEGVMVLLLSRFLPVEVCLAISLLFRALNVAKEVLLAVVALRVAPRVRSPVAAQPC